jgi:hypothetical protein
LVWLVALALGFVLRALPLTAARPYIAYIDEGNFLHPAFRLVRDGGWDPRSYLYPQLPAMAVVAAARTVDPIYRSVRGRSLRERIRERVEVYDELEPFALLFLARCMGLALGMAIIVLTGLLAMRLAGPGAGAAAALVAALIPALVLRGSIATVDSYATLFVLASLYATHRTTTSRRPGFASLLAGALAGAAFASKYPSVIVLAALPVTTFFQPIAGREKLRRLALAGLGLIAGAALAMPALLKHPREVYDAILQQGTFYRELSSVPLWRQTFLRSEWDLPYDRAELGFVFVALAVGGLVAGLRDRRIAPTLWGWCAFAAMALVLYARQPFQPFRNLLPLVPLSCAAIGILYVRVRERMRRPLGLDAGALLWVALAFAVPLAAYAVERYRLEDPRKQAIDWLSARIRPADEVLVVHELGFLNQEVERLRAKPTVEWWDRAGSVLLASRPRFLIGGVLRHKDGSQADVAADPVVAAAYALKLQLGMMPTTPEKGWWRENYQIVYVFERKDAQGQ